MPPRPHSSGHGGAPPRGRDNPPRLRILLVTQMWPSQANPDLGSFLVPVRRELERLGHEVEVVAISHRGGSRAKYTRLVAEAVAAARRRPPDVVFAHFLFPAGAAGALAALRPGRRWWRWRTARTSPTSGEIPGTARDPLGRRPGRGPDRELALARRAPRRPHPGGGAEALGDRLRRRPRRLRPARPAPRPARELGWEGEGPAFLCVGSLIERKNVVRLADAFERFGRGRLAFVGDGPLRGSLDGRAGVRVAGRVPQADVPRWVAACDVLCQPSLIEPFGQATLEGMAMERTVLASTIGGPPSSSPARPACWSILRDRGHRRRARPRGRAAVAQPRRPRGRRRARRPHPGGADGRGARALAADRGRRLRALPSSA